jgi:hypothetical protein
LGLHVVDWWKHNLWSFFLHLYLLIFPGISSSQGLLLGTFTGLWSAC